MTDTNVSFRPRTVSGKLVVLGLFGFSILMVSIIWAFAVIELGPFEPLAKAIKAEFPTSRPHVKGGTPRNKPPLLRIILEVDFTPTEGDARVQKMTNRVIALAKQHVSLNDYEDFELHLVHYRAEKTTERFSFEKKVRELED
jgi:hypothetical protein